MSFTESLQIDNAALSRLDKRGDGDNEKNDNDNDNNRSSQTSNLVGLGVSTTLKSPASLLGTATSLHHHPPRLHLPQPSSLQQQQAVNTPSGLHLTSPLTVLILTPDLASAAVIILLVFCIYKSLFRHRKSTPMLANSQHRRSQDTASRIWGSSQANSTTVGEIPPSVPPLTYNLAKNSVDRQESSDFVRRSLLQPQERNGSLMWSWSQRRKLQSESLIESGKNDYDGGGSNGNRQGMRMKERNKSDIEGRERWETPATIAVRDSRVESLVSLPRWRDPVTWVRDQEKRNRR
ncbi:hypothetical protein BGZ60DRAFT_426597 [Tricladium varicosporioides]|nr:hypothetical protein BGZ60DRAFT_426597 [Hymenoscyphus varicosporioides]